MRSTLGPLQIRVLHVLAGFSPPWTLTGGGALCGFYLGHRETRDLDLFWHGEARLGRWIGDVELLLREAGLEVTPIQTSASFRRIQVRYGEDTTIVDLVADPVPLVEQPRALADGILVDGPHEILVNKLAALLSRSEPRDLVDVRALVEAGGDLGRALADAPAKDGGFSPLTLAWVLDGLDTGGDAGLERSRAWLQERLLRR